VSNFGADLGRVPIEGEDRRAQSAGAGQVVNDAEHCLMPEMDAVERSDRDRAAVHTVDGRVDGIGIPPDNHGDVCGARTTVGFTPAPRRS
jgi:hypothetical protein